jgi:hypothetical protein
MALRAAGGPSDVRTVPMHLMTSLTSAAPRLYGRATVLQRLEVNLAPGSVTRSAGAEGPACPKEDS